MPYLPTPVTKVTVGKKSGGSGIPAKYISFHDVATNQFVGFVDFFPLKYHA